MAQKLVYVARYDVISLNDNHYYLHSQSIIG